MLGFVARQPIFDARGQLFAYELLFRSGPENAFTHDDLDHASRSVIQDSLEVFGFDELTGGRRAFVNVTRDVLVEGLYESLPPERTVLELLETVEADPDVVAASRIAKQRGYLLALDDFVLRPGLEALVPLADFIKIDVLATTPAERLSWLEKLGATPVRLLAEKIETKAQFDEAVASGFTYFQGYWFQRPEMLSARVIPPHKRSALRIVGELNASRFDLDRLSRLIRHESQMAERLLADLNGTSGGHAVMSVRQAFALLGDRSFRRWATLVALSTLAEDRPPELFATGLLRAHFCESLARASRLDESDLFLAGLLSAADALLGRPRSDVLSYIDLPATTAAAFNDADSAPGRALDLVLRYERGDWAGVSTRARTLGVPEERIPGFFRDAVGWANRLGVR